MSAEVEDMLKRFQMYKNIVGIVVVNTEGIPIKTTLDNTTTIQYTALMSTLVDKARQVVQDLDATNEFFFMRLRTQKHEIIVVPEENYFIIVVQNPAD